MIDQISPHKDKETEVSTIKFAVASPVGCCGDLHR